MLERGALFSPRRGGVSVFFLGRKRRPAGPPHPVLGGTPPFIFGPEGVFFAPQRKVFPVSVVFFAKKSTSLAFLEDVFLSELPPFFVRAERFLERPSSFLGPSVCEKPLLWVFPPVGPPEKTRGGFFFPVRAFPGRGPNLPFFGEEPIYPWKGPNPVGGLVPGPGSVNILCAQDFPPKNVSRRFERILTPICQGGRPQKICFRDLKVWWEKPPFLR